MSRPLLTFGSLLVLGIVTGRETDVASLFAMTFGEGSATFYLLISTLVLLALTALLRKTAWASITALSIAAFAMGLFLITNADNHNPAELHGQQRAEKHWQKRSEGRSHYHNESRHSETENAFEAFMLQQRTRLSEIYREQGISGDGYAIVAAMTLGEKERVGKELKETYVVSGASHVFALSGLHLSIIFMLLTLLLPTREFPKTTVVVQLVALWTYVMLVGLHPSILRAAIMLSIYSLCKLLVRKPHSIDVLLFAGFIIVCFKPQWLFDVGFQMSFMAVLSIVLLYPPIFNALPVHDRYYAACEELDFYYQKKVFDNQRQEVSAPQSSYKKQQEVSASQSSYKNLSEVIPLYLKRTMWWGMTWIWASFVLSFTAQLGVLPLIAHYFHRVSTYGLLVNFVVSPAALIIISLALCLFLLLLIAALVAFWPLLHEAVTAIAGWCGYIINGVATLLNDFLTFVAHLPYASIDGVHYSTLQVLLTYLLIALISLFVVKWRRYRRVMRL